MNTFVSSFKKTNKPHSLFLPTKEKIKSQAEGKWEKWKIAGLGVGRKRGRWEMHAQGVNKEPESQVRNPESL